MTMQVNKSTSEITGKISLWPLKINGVYATEGELLFWETKIKNECQAYISSACLVETTNWEDGLIKGYTCVAGVDIKPKSKFGSMSDSVKTKNPNFFVRSRAGEIIMSPMRRRYISTVTESILTSDSPWKRTSATIPWSTLGYKSGPGGLYLAPGVVATALTSGSPAFGHYRKWNYNCYWSNPPVLPPSLIWDQLQGLDNTELITKTYSDANKKAVDVLTSFAELPETIKSVLKGFREVVRLIKDVRTRNFELLKNRTKRLENLQSRHQKQLDRLRSRSNQSNNARESRLIERQIRERKIEYSKQVKSVMDEFVSAIANVWLNFRYNIMPNVYLAEDVIRAINSYDQEYARTQSGTDTTREIMWMDNVVGQIPAHFKCVIKRQFDLGNIPWNSTLSANLFSTGWELLPLSFVVDWFVNIGDIISSVTTPVSWKQQAAGLASKFEGSSNKLVDSPTLKAIIKIDVKCYDFQTFQPLDKIGLSFPMDLSPVRQLDALALIWQPVRLLLRNASR